MCKSTIVNYKGSLYADNLMVNGCMLCILLRVVNLQVTFVSDLEALTCTAQCSNIKCCEVFFRVMCNAVFFSTILDTLGSYWLINEEHIRTSKHFSP